MTDWCQEINPLKASQLAQDHNNLLIDIRSASDWVQGIPSDATMMSVEQLLVQESELRAQFQRIFLLCYQGQTSLQWARRLGPPFQSVQGGFAAWQNANLSQSQPDFEPTVNRYDRQIKLLGEAAQSRLAKSHVLVVGAGGLGAPALLYLAGAGVGKITLLDADQVALHNLHRQIIYQQSEVGKNKALSAAGHLQQLNQDIEVVALDEHLDANNAEPLMSAADVVLDGTDNLATRYLINDTSLKLKKPWIFAAVDGFDLQVALFTGDRSQPCYRCLFPDLEGQNISNCNAGGILGPVPGLAAMLQCNEALKLLTATGSLLCQQMLSFDVLNHQYKVLKYPSGQTCKH